MAEACVYTFVIVFLFLFLFSILFAGNWAGESGVLLWKCEWIFEVGPGEGTALGQGNWRWELRY